MKLDKERDCSLTSKALRRVGRGYSGRCLINCHVSVILSPVLIIYFFFEAHHRVKITLSDMIFANSILLILVVIVANSI